MAVKTITVTEEAYAVVKGLKAEDESFSKLFLRLGHMPLRVHDVIGVLRHSPEEAEAFARRVCGIRERAGRDSEGRMDDVRTRFKYTH